MLATQTYNFLIIMKLQLQLQFYLKTHKDTNTEKSDYTLADDELWSNQVLFTFFYEPTTSWS